MDCPPIGAMADVRRRRGPTMHAMINNEEQIRTDHPIRRWMQVVGAFYVLQFVMMAIVGRRSARSARPAH